MNEEKNTPSLWSKQWDYSVIEHIPLLQLEKLLIENNIYNPLDTPSGKWLGFSKYYGVKHGLNKYETQSFASMISLMMTDVPSPIRTDEYYFEEKIEKRIIKTYKNLDEDMSEEDKVKFLFQEVFHIYHDEIYNYEVKLKRIMINMSMSEYLKFMEIEGDNHHVRFRKLLYPGD